MGNWFVYYKTAFNRIKPDFVVLSVLLILFGSCVTEFIPETTYIVLTSDKGCIDCTVRGSNIRPDFWDDKCLGNSLL